MPPPALSLGTQNPMTEHRASGAWPHRGACDQARCKNRDPRTQMPDQNGGLRAGL